MTVKMNNYEVSAILTVLAKITEEFQKTIDIRTSYRISKIARALSPHDKEINESRQKLIEAHAKRDKDGEFERPQNSDGTVNKDSVSLKDPQAFQKEFSDFMSESIEVELSTKLSLEALDKCGVKLPPMEVGALECILEDVD